MLYWTGDGQIMDLYKVAAENGERYKDKVHGWWVDGCYDHIGYNQKRWSILANGLGAVNRKRIIALNNPSMSHANSSTLEDDFTTGENYDLGEIPTSRWVDGVQWQTLSFLGKDWDFEGVRYERDWLADYVYKCNQLGGVISIDVLLSGGSIERSHIVTLKGMNNRLEKMKEQNQ